MMKGVKVMDLTKEQREKTIAVTTFHPFKKKYMVVLRECFINKESDEGIGLFDTKDEVVKFIDDAVPVKK